MSKKEKVEFQNYSERTSDKPAIDDKLINKIKDKKIGKIVDVAVYLVNDELIRNTADIDFTMGSSWAHSSFIPTKEIWISNLLAPRDYGPVIVHEFIESYLMSKHNLSYEDAHEFANIFEGKFRRKIFKKEIKIGNSKDALKEAGKIIRSFLSEAVTKL